MTPTIDDIIQDIGEACTALQRLPRERVPRLAQSWPDIIRTRRESYGHTGDPSQAMDAAPFAYRNARMPATMEQLAALERFTDWLFLLGDAEERQMVLLRGMGLSWRRIAKMRRDRLLRLGVLKGGKKDACRLIYKRAVMRIYRHECGRRLVTASPGRQPVTATPGPSPALRGAGAGPMVRPGQRRVVLSRAGEENAHASA
jgi:hypothetical protein